MRAAREYERKCKELQDEREKYRKQLEIEMKKTENGIAEDLHHFDGLLTQVSSPCCVCVFLCHTSYLSAISDQSLG